MTSIEIEELASTFFTSDNATPIVKIIFSDGRKVKRRLFKTRDNIICCFTNLSRRYGINITTCGDIVDIIPVRCKPKSESQKWEEGWKKVKTKLEISGLWAELLDEINLALDIGYEKFGKICREYWGSSDRVATVGAMEPRLIGISNDGTEYIKTDLLYHYASPPKVKTMYFGKRVTATIRERIKHALINKKSIKESARDKYDVSFEYMAEHNRAWYNEEYKNCGNGHYYIALNDKHCLFMEDD